MRTRLLTACGVGLLAVAPAAAQVSYLPGSSLQPDRPTELPPLLKPPDPTLPHPPGPPGPKGEYDPGYLYLPDQAPGPKLPPCPCRPLGRWWIIPSVDLGWSQPARVPALLHLGVPDGRGGVAAGPVVYGGERVSLPFRAGFGLEAGAWLDRCQNHGIDASFFFLGRGTNDT